ncbi:MAG: hypothetical protein JWM03_487 [Rhodocyclales bacterium]|nr:hypothetical protein [Rhodocyclales bacterium]MDB5887615.1 hypothetical protein [Rhodocyclales bacterium]
MKKLILLLMAISAFLSGCIAYEVPERDGGAHRAEHDHDHDRDRDGASDRRDRHSDDLRRD